MEYIRNEKNVKIAEAICEAIHENAAYLSEIDGAIGDGDHGVNMNKGFLMEKERLLSLIHIFLAFLWLGVNASSITTLGIQVSGVILLLILAVFILYLRLYHKIGRKLEELEKH